LTVTIKSIPFDNCCLCFFIRFFFFLGIQVLPIATGSSINHENLVTVAHDPSMIFEIPDIEKISTRIHEIVNTSCEYSFIGKFKIQYPPSTNSNV